MYPTISTLEQTVASPRIVPSTSLRRSRQLALTLWRLGPGNVLRVVLYRIALRVGYWAWRTPVAHSPDGPFLSPGATCACDDGAKRTLARVTLTLFGHHVRSFDAPPDWFANPLQPDKARANADSHWSRIADFDADTGDIKAIWETSRFDWLPALAMRAAGGQHPATACTIEHWLADWSRHNPPNRGTHWKCAQETALRSLNLYVAFVLSGEDQPTPGLARLLIAHMQRILPTTLYARAQRNNHATSEAAALFAVGSLLMRCTLPDAARIGAHAARRGRVLLESSVATTVLADGSFSQYSLTYHRLMLETLGVAELARRRFSAPSFSSLVQLRLRAATRWFAAFIDPITGDAPNLGPNDGAMPFNLSDLPYRDFRPTLQRARVLFDPQPDTTGIRVHDPLLEAFGYTAIQPDRRHLPTGDCAFLDGGYTRLALHDNEGGQERGFALLRLPQCRFRPGDCDGNHLDVWLDGRNLLRDGGTWSYHGGAPALEAFFAGTASHSTVMFDGHDQMPALGRFLRGAWLKPERTVFDADAGCMGASYRDQTGARHERLVERCTQGLKVTDRLADFDHAALLRWRLAPGDWVRVPGGVRCSFATLVLSVDGSTAADAAIDLRCEPESLHYLALGEVPVLVLSVHEACTVESSIRFEPYAQAT